MAQNNAMFVYRNDGQINAFLKSDVDSIVYSQIDVDSLVHGEYVVQEVWTVDSVYRIPLEVIDSVSFTSLHHCPDDNHPHAIDLGLPSGTKWCCCNVGASTPEGYGGYYAWGETREKSNYDNYAFYDSSTGDYINIGSDIAGTSYDVARVRMGAPWRMPTHEQQMELSKNCTWQWTQQNGVNGMLVTGPSGGQVFLPAAGYRWREYLYDAGSYGFYWSSSLYPDGGGYACSLYFNSGSWNWGGSNRNNGRSVRAVCP